MLIRREGKGDWHKPATTAFGNEQGLQDLLADSPGLIPGLIEPAAVAREVYLPGAGYADLLLVEGSGDMTIVECKLSSNPDIRRSVVGQVLAYAAALSRLSYADVDAACSQADQTLAGWLESSDADDWDEESFRQTVSENLERGAFRLVIAVDEITDELKLIVAYLNQHTGHGLRLLALELRRAVDEGVEILMPETFGEESAGESPGSGPVLADWKYYEGALSPEKFAIAQKLYERMKSVVDAHGYPWELAMRRGYLGFQRQGGYYMAGIQLYRSKPITLWIKLPDAPEALRQRGESLDDPCPELNSYWDAANKQWTWEVPGLDDVPDVEKALEVTARYEPAAGPMVL